MKTRYLCSLLCLLSMCTPLKAADPVTMTPSATAAAASNAFGIDLYAELRSKSGNLCISPYSLSAALDMTAAGARGQTASQMLSVLHWSNDIATLPAATAALASELAGPQLTDEQRKERGGPELSIANAIFGQQGYPYRKPFLDLLAIQYGAPLRTVDFINKPEGTRSEINQWAAEQTHGRIKEALPPSSLDASTRMVLVNALYFKAGWQETFSRRQTTKQPFYQDGKEPADVQFMHRQDTFGYMENDELLAVELPYSSGFSFVVMLPKKREGLPDLEKSLTAGNIDGWTGKFDRQVVEVYLPQFKIEGSYDLADALGKLGMPDAFHRDTADFSGMVSSDRLSIDRVVHKTFMSVDEDGTEAAAVTGAVMRMTAMMPRSTPPRAIVFRADHPFLFMIRHHATGAILFMGRLTNPGR